MKANPIVSLMFTTTLPLSSSLMRAYDALANRGSHCPAWSMNPQPMFSRMYMRERKRKRLFSRVPTATEPDTA